MRFILAIGLILGMLSPSLAIIFPSRMSQTTVNGGNNCIACSVVVALTEQLAIVYNETVDASLARLCNYLPKGIFQTACVDGIKQFGPMIISGFE